MRHQVERRDSKDFVVVDEDCGIPTSIVESYRASQENGPLAQSDPRSYLLSMSEYDKAQGYDVYADYQTATRPDHGSQAYGGLAAHPDYHAGYVASHAQVPSGLPQSSHALGLVPNQAFPDAHDQTYYGHPVGQYDASYLQPPRPLPDITGYTPQQGQQGTKVTVYFQSIYNFDVPQVAPVLMFGHKRCESILDKSAPQGQVFQYGLTAEVPPLSSTGSSTSHVALHLLLDDGTVNWESPSIEIGNFEYIPDNAYYQLDSPRMPAQQLQAPRKRKLSIEASPRRSPTKKMSMQQLGGLSSGQPASVSPSSFRRPSIPDHYHQGRRVSTADYQQSYGAGTSLSRMPSQQHYYQSIPSLQASQSPSWSYAGGMHHATRSPSAATISSVGKSSQLLPSPAVPNPQLIRTSTLQHSPTTPGATIATTPATFNPYAVYPPNTKALLKIEGELSTMIDKWTETEWEAKRRLVQFRRSQTGSVITAAFEPVTLEDRIPNSICVSCIWWEEKQDYYVTSVDTISLLESLVAVRFTVEEKNRIRRNLEGFRPATVSKTKQDSEDFFKLIMGFPNPKPRNIEKDVKVFPWRILGTALKKIIGKYASHSCIAYAHARPDERDPQLTAFQSASYSSTAGILHTPAVATYAVSRPPDVGFDSRPIASPRSTSSSATSHGHAYPPTQHMQGNVYATHAAGPGALGLGPSGDLRLSVPTSAGAQATSWHQPSAHYTSELTMPSRTWEFSGGYLGAAPATGLPGTTESYPYQQRVPSLTGPSAMPSEARFVPLHDYDGHSQPTSTA